MKKEKLRENFSELKSCEKCCIRKKKEKKKKIHLKKYAATRGMKCIIKSSGNTLVSSSKAIQQRLNRGAFSYMVFCH